ncbi:hypothetical protein EII17_08495 [Clostridiales bacterium COT073_COT-073]|nr:hypothetical protein EII17_08495 [Clostridiales bacterium COT073_COT-073]
MSSLSSFSRAVSGMRSHQLALNVTTHNLTNIKTPGYSRQLVLYNDARYVKVGQNGTTLMQVGLGTDIQMIRQARDLFLDQAYRAANGKKQFYAGQEQAMSELQAILGEPYQQQFNKSLNDLASSMHELVQHPDGLETRGVFIKNAGQFLEKANLIGEQLKNYQLNLNEQIIQKVNRINEIGHQLKEINQLISREEIGRETGLSANANDYRDQRNKLLDELSGLVQTRYVEEKNGVVNVTIEAVPFVQDNFVYELAMTPAREKSPLVDPYWPHLSNKNVVPPQIYKLISFDNPIGPEYNNNSGELKGLILARGDHAANYTELQDKNYYEKNIKPSAVMNIQAQFDNLIHDIVTMINNLLVPKVPSGTPGKLQLDTANAPWGLKNAEGVAVRGEELFVRKYLPHHSQTGGLYDAEDPNNEYSLYSAANLKINEEILNDYNKLALSKDINDIADTKAVVEKMIEAWGKNRLTLEPGATHQETYVGYYRSMIDALGNKAQAIENNLKGGEALLYKINYERSTVMSVSQDEEFGNLIKYQHAYNASARLVGVIDSMMDRLINQTGLVGR